MNGAPRKPPLVAAKGHSGAWRVHHHLPAPTTGEWCPMCAKMHCGRVVLERLHGGERLTVRACAVREVGR